MKVEIDLPDDFLAWLERQPLTSDLAGASVPEKLRFLLQYEIDYFRDAVAEERHQALLRLLGVENIIDVPRGDDEDDDIPF